MIGNLIWLPLEGEEALYGYIELEESRRAEDSVTCLCTNCYQLRFASQN